MSINKEEFRSLPYGWMEINDCIALSSYLQNHSFLRILEIGSFCGRSTRLLTRFSSPKATIVSVDYWCMNIYLQIPAIHKLIVENKIYDVYSNFKLNCPNAHPIRGSIIDLQVQAQVSNISSAFDLCFIDADRRPDNFYKIFDYAKSVSPHIIGAHFNPSFPEYFSALNKMKVRNIPGSALWAWTSSAL